MRTCPRFGAELAIIYPYGPTAWVESCSICGYQGGGTVSFAHPLGPDAPEVANDDLPILVVCVVDAGPRRDRMFQLYRHVLGASPRQAKTLLDADRVEVARGPRMDVERFIHEFDAAGATVEVSTA